MAGRLRGRRVAALTAGVFVTIALVLAACTDRVPRGESPFPAMYSKDAAHPVEIVAEKTFTRADEAPRDARDALTSGNSRYLRDVVTFTSQAGKGPLHVVLDYAGLENEKVEYPEHREVQAAVSVACPQLKRGCSETRSDVRPLELRFYVGALNDSGVPRRDVYVDGRWRTAHLGRSEVSLPVTPGTSATVYAAFKPPPRFDTYQLRVTAFYGDAVLKQRSRAPALANAYGRYAVLPLFAFLALYWWRVSRESAGEAYDSPKLLGLLLVVLGFILAASGFVFNDGYFAVLGVLFAYTGVFLRLGLSAARLSMTLVVLVAWGWSLAELGLASPRELFMRTGMPTLVWLYVLSSRVSSRLGSRRS